MKSYNKILLALLAASQPGAGLAISIIKRLFFDNEEEKDSLAKEAFKSILPASFLLDIGDITVGEFVNDIKNAMKPSDNKTQLPINYSNIDNVDDDIDNYEDIDINDDYDDDIDDYVDDDIDDYDNSDDSSWLCLGCGHRIYDTDEYLASDIHICPSCFLDRKELIYKSEADYNRWLEILDILNKRREI